MLLLLAASCSLPLIAATASDNVKGLNDFRALSVTSLDLIQNLYNTSLKGNLKDTQEAYAVMRAPYESIETLAAAFPDLDSDIDARAYAFTDGGAFNNETEASESGVIFKGNHRVELILFAEQNVSKAQWWIADLVNSSIALTNSLTKMKSFSPEDTFGGMAALAFEVGSKKFSSEEETYSDLSIIIFTNNFKGIEMQFDAYEDEIKAASPEAYKGMEDALKAAMASVKPFGNETGSLGGVTPYSKLSVKERSTIQAAAYDLGVAVEKAATSLGVMQVSPAEEDDCKPDGTTPNFKTGVASSPVGTGLNYFKALLPYQAKEAKALTAAITSKDLAAAKAAYTRMRPIYEQIECLAPVFDQIDTDIDAREYAFPTGELSNDFKGNHRLERLIFRDGDLGAKTLAYSKGLETSFAELSKALNNSSDFNPSINFEGIIGLATEVPDKKVSSEEETSSGLSHLIFYNNWKGIYSQTAPYLPFVPKPLGEALGAAVKAAAKCLPIKTTDSILEVNASDVTAAFAEALASADYGSYFNVTDAEKMCIVTRGYAIRDTVLAIAKAGSFMNNCNPYLKSPLYSTTPRMAFDPQSDSVSKPAVTSAMDAARDAAVTPVVTNPPGTAVAPAASPPASTAGNSATSNSHLHTTAAAFAVILGSVCAALI